MVRIHAHRLRSFRPCRWQFVGRQALTVNALGVETVTAYDANGNVVSEEGATYPVRYACDTQGRRVAMWTNRSGDEWDMTRWAYDPATRLCTSKTYEDGSVVTYEYTPDGLLETTRTADGHWTRNIYDAKRQLVGVQYDDASDVTYVRDAYGRESSAANGNAAYAYTLAPCGIATGESVTIGVTNYTLLRGLDDQGRITSFGIENSGRTSCLNFAYRPDGRIGSVTNGDVTVDYAYSDAGYDTGYTLAVEGGATFVRTLVRDPYWRGLVTAVVNSQGADYAYSYDALSRPMARNGDSFTYNFRSEVIGASVGGNNEVYGYDNIGNMMYSSFNTMTNRYTSNGLNQYTSINQSNNRTIEQSEQSNNLTYDADGNLVSFGDWAYAYDSAARLTEVRSNGVLVASNYFDHQGRRVRLVTSEASYTFVYNGWNVVLELVDHNGVTDRIEYYWGKDISGSLQGAGGVGGLLYLKINGTVYVPINDAYGNVMEYRNSDGSLAAAYVYDSFGRTISQTGSLADAFRFRYSTRSFEREMGIYYYGKRFYSPILRRWLSRDPLEEQGGVNIYASCGNNMVCDVDSLGEKVKSPATTKWEKVGNADTAEFHTYNCVEFGGHGNREQYVKHFTERAFNCMPENYRSYFVWGLIGELNMNGDKDTCWCLNLIPFEIYKRVYMGKVQYKLETTVANFDKHEGCCPKPEVHMVGVEGKSIKVGPR